MQVEFRCIHIQENQLAKRHQQYSIQLQSKRNDYLINFKIIHYKLTEHQGIFTSDLIFSILSPS